MSKIKQREPGKIVGYQDRQLSVGDYALKSYVDEHLKALQTGVLKHAAVAILNTPPANPTPGSIYIVGKNPGGAWTGLANHIAMSIPAFNAGGASWGTFPPADKEERLVESSKEIFQYSAASGEWNALAVASTVAGGKVSFESDHVYHQVLSIPAGWKHFVVEAQGLIHTETNNAVSKVGFIGTVPALSSIITRAAFWGHSHNDYQYAEATWWKSNMLEGTAFKANYPIGGHTYGAGSIYRWRVELTANYKSGYVMVHCDVNGVRGASSHYLCRYITETQLKLAPDKLTGLDLGFNGQEIDMMGTYETTL